MKSSPKNKKVGIRYTEVSVERIHNQMRNPAWASFPASYLVSCTVLYKPVGRFYLGRYLGTSNVLYVQ